MKIKTLSALIIGLSLTVLPLSAYAEPAVKKAQPQTIAETGAQITPSSTGSTAKELATSNLESWVNKYREMSLETATILANGTAVLKDGTVVHPFKAETAIEQVNSEQQAWFNKYRNISLSTATILANGTAVLKDGTVVHPFKAENIASQRVGMLQKLRALLHKGKPLATSN